MNFLELLISDESIRQTLTTAPHLYAKSQLMNPIAHRRHDEEIRTQMRWALAPDYEIVLAEDRTTAIDRFPIRPTLVFLLDFGTSATPGTPSKDCCLVGTARDRHLGKIVIG